MKNNTRISRINDEIFKEVSQIVRGELKDPRIGAMTSSGACGYHAGFEILQSICICAGG